MTGSNASIPPRTSTSIAQDRTEAGTPVRSRSPAPSRRTSDHPARPARPATPAAAAPGTATARAPAWPGPAGRRSSGRLPGGPRCPARLPRRRPARCGCPRSSAGPQPPPPAVPRSAPHCQLPGLPGRPAGITDAHGCSLPGAPAAPHARGPGHSGRPEARQGPAPHAPTGIVAGRFPAANPLAATPDDQHDEYHPASAVIAASRDATPLRPPAKPCARHGVQRPGRGRDLHGSDRPATSRHHRAHRAPVRPFAARLVGEGRHRVFRSTGIDPAACAPAGVFAAGAGTAPPGLTFCPVGLYALFAGRVLP